MSRSSMRSSLRVASLFGALGALSVFAFAAAGCGSDSGSDFGRQTDAPGFGNGALAAPPAPGQPTGLDANAQQGTDAGQGGGGLGQSQGGALDTPAPGEQPGSGTPAPGAGEPGTPVFEGLPAPPAPGQQTGRGDEPGGSGD